MGAILSREQTVPVYAEAAVAVDTNWTLVCTVPVAGKIGYVLLELLNSGAAALTNLRIARGTTAGSTGAAKTAGVDYIVVGEDSDINSSNVVIDSAFPNPAYTLAASKIAHISVLVDGCAEIAVYAKSSGTSLGLQRALMPQIART